LVVQLWPILCMRFLNLTSDLNFWYQNCDSRHKRLGYFYIVSQLPVAGSSWYPIPTLTLPAVPNLNLDHHANALTWNTLTSPPCSSLLVCNVNKFRVMELAEFPLNSSKPSAQNIDGISIAQAFAVRHSLSKLQTLYSFSGSSCFWPCNIKLILCSWFKFRTETSSYRLSNWPFMYTSNTKGSTGLSVLYSLSFLPVLNFLRTFVDLFRADTEYSDERRCNQWRPTTEPLTHCHVLHSVFPRRRRYCH